MPSDILSIDNTLEELKLHKQKYEEASLTNLDNLKRLNEILIKKLETGPINPQVTGKTKMIQEKFSELSALIEEKSKLFTETNTKLEIIKKLYHEQKQALLEEESCVKESVSSTTNIIPIESSVISQQEILEIQAERDKALGLAKVLLATLQSCRMELQENFHKLKYSSDLMFHILYKAEDAFLDGNENATE